MLENGAWEVDEDEIERLAELARVTIEGNAASSDRLLDADEVAALLSVPTSWVRQETRAGRMPCLELGRYRRYDRGAVLGGSRHAALANGVSTSPRQKEEHDEQDRSRQSTTADRQAGRHDEPAAKAVEMTPAPCLRCGRLHARRRPASPRSPPFARTAERMPSVRPKTRTRNCSRGATRGWRPRRERATAGREVREQRGRVFVARQAVLPAPVKTDRWGRPIR